MHYYPTGKSLDSAIERIEYADRLLGGNLKVTDTHKVFRPVLVPALIGTAAAVAAVVCLWIFVHPLAGISGAVVFALIAKRIRDRRLNMKRSIVYCRGIERRVDLEYVLNDGLAEHPRLKEQYEASLVDTDPGERRAELAKVFADLNEITSLLAHDVGNT